MTQIAGPFATTVSTTGDRRAGDAPALAVVEPVPAGYVSYAPSRTSTPDRYFFALAVIHFLRCASSAVDASSASTRSATFAAALLPMLLAVAHGTLAVGCHNERRWAKLGSILLDVQASVITVVAILAVSDSGLGWSTVMESGVAPALTIWLACRARVDRRRR
jgi:hypothetical protein